MNQFGGSRTDTLVKLVLIFFISLLSFSVGTFIGKTVTEKQYKDTMYEPTGEEVEQASNDEDSKDAIDDEALSLTDEFAKIKKETKEKGRAVASEHDEKAAAAHDTHAAPAAHDDHGAHEAPKMATVKPEAKKAAAKTEKIDMHGSNAGHNGHHDMMPEAATRVAVGKPPTAAHKTAAPKASSLPNEVGATTTGKYTIQIASYAKEDEANKHSADLNSKGFSAFVVPAQIKGQTWYRVSVGQFPTQSEAAGYKEEFVKKSNISKVIIQKIAQ
jgi:septal ring-binding cell division protein DamX